jgi:hypothetical protein
VGGARTFFIWNDFGLSALENGNARIRGAKVNADDLCHD